MIKHSKRIKSTVSNFRKTEVVDSSWQESATPPGSVITSGACVHRGSLGTWEIRLSPLKEIQKGKLEKQNAKAGDEASFQFSESKRKHETSDAGWYFESSESEGSEDGQSEVLADHSTDSEVV